jgi:coenzyme F420-reducing hydrogenase delta subunit
LTGCAEGNCFYRQGIEWTEQRIAATRDPHLRKRVPRERLSTVWAGTGGKRRFESELAAFQARLRALSDEEVSAVSGLETTGEER